MEDTFFFMSYYILAVCYMFTFKTDTYIIGQRFVNLHSISNIRLNIEGNVFFFSFFKTNLLAFFGSGILSLEKILYIQQQQQQQ